MMLKCLHKNDLQRLQQIANPAYDYKRLAKDNVFSISGLSSDRYGPPCVAANYIYVRTHLIIKYKAFINEIIINK